MASSPAAAYAADALAAPRDADGSPAWISCFCEAWKNGVVYSPAGPWFSETVLERLLDCGDTAGRGASSSAAAAASHARVVRDIMASQGGSSFLGSRGASAGLRVDTGASAARGSAGPSAGRGASPPAGGRSTHSSAASNGLSFYTENPYAAKADVLRCFLQRVPASLMPAVMPDSISGASRGMEWYVLRSAVDLPAFPGLLEWLTDRHAGALRHASGVELSAVLALIAAGGDTGVIALARPTAKGHPLSREKDRDGMGAFFRTPLGRGVPIGFYPGMLTDMDSCEKWMNTLPTVLGGGEEEGARAASAQLHLASAASAAVAATSGTATGGVGKLSSTSASSAVGAACATPSSLTSASYAPPPLSVYADMLCQSKLWTYDYAAPALPGQGVHTYQGAFVRNAMCGINDFHGIGPE